MSFPSLTGVLMAVHACSHAGEWLTRGSCARRRPDLHSLLPRVLLRLHRSPPMQPRQPTRRRFTKQDGGTRVLGTSMQGTFSLRQSGTQVTHPSCHRGGGVWVLLNGWFKTIEEGAY